MADNFTVLGPKMARSGQGVPGSCHCHRVAYGLRLLVPGESTLFLEGYLA